MWRVGLREAELGTGGGDGEEGAGTEEEGVVLGGGTGGEVEANREVEIIDGDPDDVVGFLAEGGIGTGAELTDDESLDLVEDVGIAEATDVAVDEEKVIGGVFDVEKGVAGVVFHAGGA